MARKIKLQPEDLRAQADRLASCADSELSAIMEKTSRAVSLMQGALEGKFINNMQVKSTGVKRQYEDLLNQLTIGVSALRRCADMYKNTDADLAKMLDSLLASTPNACLAIYPTETGSAGANSNTGYDSYREKTDAITEKVPIGQTQQYLNNADRTGLCTYAATTTLLRRKQAADGLEPTFEFRDVKKANKGSDIYYEAADAWEDTPGAGFSFSTKYTKEYPEGFSYVAQMKYENGKKSTDAVVQLLNEHPEGIIVYANYPSGIDRWSGKYHSSGLHAIVITDYVEENGKIQFYADDPVNDRDYAQKNRIPIEETWLASRFEGNIETLTEKIFENASQWMYF